MLSRDLADNHVRKPGGVKTDGAALPRVPGSMRPAWRRKVDLRSACDAPREQPRVIGRSLIRWSQPFRLAVTALTLTLTAGCSQSSKWGRRTSPPAGPLANPYNAANPYPTGNYGAVPPNQAVVPGGPQAGPNSQVMWPTRQAGPPPNVNQVRGPEVVATPRPDAAGPGPSATPLCPPGQGPGPVGPPAIPTRKWRGFLPAHGTDEDRPGWWTPDYGGGTSA
jgi:hypothetical protein